MATPQSDRMSFQRFVDWSLSVGTVAKYNDGEFLGECVSLINQYCWRVLNVPADAWGDAKDWATNANVAKYFDKVKDLKAGDILVYGSAFGGGAGHIELYLGGGLVLGQNRDFRRRVGRYKTLPGYSTILRVKGETMQKTALKYLVKGTLNRNVTAADEKQYLSKEANGVIIDINKWAEANGRSYGQAVAARDKTIADQGKRIKQLEAEVAVVSDDTAQLNALGKSLQWFVKRVGVKQ